MNPIACPICGLKGQHKLQCPNQEGGRIKGPLNLIRSVGAVDPQHTSSDGGEGDSRRSLRGRTERS